MNENIPKNLNNMHFIIDAFLERFSQNQPDPDESPIMETARKRAIKIPTDALEPEVISELKALRPIRRDLSAKLRTAVKDQQAGDFEQITNEMSETDDAYNNLLRIFYSSAIKYVSKEELIG